MEEQRQEDLTSPLIEAALAQDVGALAENLRFAGQRMDGGLTALMVCARQGFLDGVVLLANDEANMRDDEGNTALMHACHTDCYGAIKLLEGVEGGYVNKKGESALQVAERCGCAAQVVALLAEREARRPAFEEAVRMACE